MNSERCAAAAEQVLAAQTMYHDTTPNSATAHSANESSPDTHQAYPLDMIRDDD